MEKELSYEKISKLLNLTKDTEYSFGQNLSGRWYLYDSMTEATIYIDSEDDLDAWIKSLEKIDNEMPINVHGVIHDSVFM